MNGKSSMLVLLLVALVVLGGAYAIVRHEGALPFLKTQPEAPGGPPQRQGLVCAGLVDLERGCNYLAPTKLGRVVAVPARENEPIEKGQPLLRLDDTASRERVAEAGAALKAAQAQLAEARNGPQIHRLRLEAQLQTLAAVRSKLTVARQVLTRKQGLLTSGVVDAIDVAIAKGQVQEVTALEQVELKKLQELSLHDPSLSLRRAEADTARFEALLRQAEDDLANCTLRAPCAGTVLRVLVNVGDVVGGPFQHAVIVFAGNGDLIVRAEVEQEFAKFVTKDQEVFVQDEMDSTVTFPAKVIRLSNWFLKRREIMQGPTLYSDNRTLECIVAPAPGHPQLRIGQRVRVLFQAPPTGHP